MRCEILEFVQDLSLFKLLKLSAYYAEFERMIYGVANTVHWNRDIFN
jgi:hypothetical protein